jgi:uncharacterized protein YkwD
MLHRSARVLLMPLLLAAVLVQPSSPAAALQSIVFSGLVDNTDGSPVAGATVTVGGQQFVTDDNGAWSGPVDYAPTIREFVTASGYATSRYRDILFRGPNSISPRLHDTLRSIFEPDPEYFARDPGTPPTITNFTSNGGSSRSQELPPETSAVTVTGTVGNRDGQSQVRPIAFLGRPDDFVDEVPMAIQGDTFEGKFPITHGAGVYRLEINDTTGAAIINVPLFVGVPFEPEPPIWPDEADLADDGPTARALEAIQQLRQSHNLAPYAPDPRLERAAQDHVADMLAHRWVCHCFGDGSNIEAHVRAAGIEPALFPVPNVPNRFTVGVGNAIATIPGAAAVRGLFASPGHRTDLLANYTHIGLAYGGEQASHTGRLSIVYAREQ